LNPLPSFLQTDNSIAFGDILPPILAETFVKSYSIHQSNSDSKLMKDKFIQLKYTAKVQRNDRRYRQVFQDEEDEENESTAYKKLNTSVNKKIISVESIFRELNDDTRITDYLIPSVASAMYPNNFKSKQREFIELAIYWFNKSKNIEMHCPKYHNINKPELIESKLFQLSGHCMGCFNCVSSKAALIPSKIIISLVNSK
jgi:hypothetical protein